MGEPGPRRPGPVRPSARRQGTDSGHVVPGLAANWVTPVMRRPGRARMTVERLTPWKGEAVASSNGVIGLQPRLAGMAGFLDRYLLPLVLIVATLGVALPAPGRRLDGDGAILITLAVLVFCTGSSVTFADIRGVRAAAGRLALVLAATTVVLPLLAWLASRLVTGAALQGGVLTAGVAPVEVASVALTGLAGGEVVVAAGLLISSTLLTVLLAGPLLRLLWRPFSDVTDRVAGHPCACRGPAADCGLRGADHRSVWRARSLTDRDPGNGIPAGAAVGDCQRIAASGQRCLGRRSTACLSCRRRCAGMAACARGASASAHRCHSANRHAGLRRGGGHRRERVRHRRRCSAGDLWGHGARLRRHRRIYIQTTLTARRGCRPMCMGHGHAFAAPKQGCTQWQGHVGGLHARGTTSS